MRESPDLFSGEREQRVRAAAPLAARMRPRTLDEVVGQRHLVAPGAAFRAMTESGLPVAVILWGPPGTGKTTLARLIAAGSMARFVPLSAVAVGVREVRAVLAEARRRLEEDRGRTVLFLDEIHRFSRAQQDALLPGVEEGIVTLVGATTENPFHEVNAPVISRAVVLRTEPLNPAEVREILERAITEPRGLAGTVAPTDEALEALASRVGGDARLALNALEIAAAIAQRRGDATVGLGDVEEALQRRVIRYDKAGDRHYDMASAFIKSLRGSDVDAALYWMWTMLEGGEDPRFVARRMVVFASEDVGLADPRALLVAVAAFHGLEVIGMPEAGHVLTEAAVYLAAAPKSNSVKRAMAAARDAVARSPGAEVPNHLRSAATTGERELGLGVGYRYPHDEPGGVAAQRYLPAEMEQALLYRPGDAGEERSLSDRLRAADEVLGKPDRRRSG